MVLGSGLDGRLALDLSTLTSDSLITPADQFYIRTSQPDQIDSRTPWTIAIRGLVKTPRVLTMDDLGPMVKPQGTHLMECAGNPRSLHFGLISAAQWAGVPLAEVLERAYRGPGPLRCSSRALTNTPSLPNDRLPGQAGSSRGISLLPAAHSWRRK